MVHGVSERSAAAGRTDAATTTAAPAGGVLPQGNASEHNGPSNGRSHRAAAVRALPVKESEEAWTPAELTEVRIELESEVARLSRELVSASSSFSALVKAGGEGAGDDSVDHGATTLSREHEMTIAKNAGDLLEQTQRALVRMTSGVYGTCESCSGPIGKARLQAFPRVTLCVPCKARGERR